MTNRPWKSDRPTVPEKFPNNAGQSAAEGMKGRGLGHAIRFSASGLKPWLIWPQAV